MSIYLKFGGFLRKKTNLNKIAIQKFKIKPGNSKKTFQNPKLKKKKNSKIPKTLKKWGFREV